MSRNRYPSSRKLTLTAVVIALVAGGIAFADDTSTSVSAAMDTPISMHGIVKDLTPEEVQAVAVFVQSK